MKTWILPISVYRRPIFQENPLINSILISSNASKDFFKRSIP